MTVDRARTVTIADVARAAQVSTATVSLVVNGQAAAPRISEATRQIVLQTVNRLGYTPNHAARSLRRRKTGVVALLVTQVDIPYHGEIATAAVAAAEARGYDLHILEARSPEEESGLLERLRGGRVDGALVATMRSPFDQAGRPVMPELERRNEARVALAQSGTPVVALLDRSPDPAVPAVRIDDEIGAYLATRHLIDLGHRVIAHVAVRSTVPADDEQTASADRFRGYHRALAEAGLPFNPSLLVGASHGPRLAAGQALGAGWHDLPLAGATAAFVSNDLLAIGVLRGLFEAGVDVPNDLAIAAFDGIELGRYVRPALTTVQHPRAELGRIGTETLVGLIDGTPAPERERVLPVHLVVRESSDPTHPADPRSTDPGSHS
jgi:DNA-binding LacI/PurR family transcriptional regulator